MKQKLLFKSLIAFLLFSQVTQAQKKEIDCSFNYKQALFYLKDYKKFKQDSLVAIEYLKPCLESGDAKSQLLMGKLHAAKKNTKDFKIAFKLFKKSAKQGNVIAMVDLAIMYKYGRGCKLNLNKAKKWFKKGAELGSDKGSYGLGYLYLKGLGSVDQNYTKAVKWLKMSEHPMAKYWLGVCYYYGYGVEQSIQKANELFGLKFDDDIVVNKFTKEIKGVDQGVTEQLVNNEPLNEIISQDISENNLYGKWSGVLLKYDWSGKQVIEKYLLNAELKYDSINESPTYTFNVENQEVKGSFIRIDNAIYFENTQMILPHISFDKKIPNKLVFDLISSDLSMKKNLESNYLVGNIDTYVRKWNEAGAPLRFVLKKKEVFTNSDEELSEEVLESLSKQEGNFIKLYPNPFKDDLVISYTLKKPSFVQVKITNINGIKNSIIEKGIQQGVGKHRYFFNGVGLEKGAYVVTIIANNQKKTRLILKK